MLALYIAVALVVLGWHLWLAWNFDAAEEIDAFAYLVGAVVVSVVWPLSVPALIAYRMAT
jgi:hypothetical protein